MQYKTSHERRKERYTNYKINNNDVINIASKHTFSIPIVPIGQTLSSIPLCNIQYAFMNEDDVKYIISQCPMSHESFNKLLLKHVTRIVPTIDPRYTPHANFSVSRSTTNDQSYPHMCSSSEIGEFCEMSSADQVVLSYWKKDKMECFKNIDSGKFVTLANFSFPNFHFGRSCSPGFGLNIYNGHPNGQCIRSHVYMHAKDALDHQYYRQEWKVSFLPFINSCLKILVTEAVQTAHYIDPLNKRLLDIATLIYFDKKVRSNRDYRVYGGLELLTLGTPKVSSFCNCNHTDGEDINPNLKNPCLKQLRKPTIKLKGSHEKKRRRYAETLVNDMGIGVPTTCGYYLHVGPWTNPDTFKPKKKRKLDALYESCNLHYLDDDCYISCFMMSGLGCAVRIRSHYYHHFHAYAFLHHTCVPYVLSQGMIYISNVPFNMIAWGDSDEDTRNKKAQAIHMGIQEPNQNYSQPRIERWFGVPGREIHPMRDFFDIE